MIKVTVLFHNKQFPFSEGEDLSYSQISPQSSTFEEDYQPIDASRVMPTILQSSFKDTQINGNSESDSSPTTSHRIKRSAKPILNESPSEYAGESKLNLGEEERGAAVPTAGRHYNLINPTNTIEEDQKQSPVRFGKELTGEKPFFEKGDPRQPLSGSPKITATPATQMANAMNANPFNRNGRQNPNPNVQDIITGIVKLLNGNVNVHANTQPSRRPIHTRINNRGPPRISDVQFTPDPPPIMSTVRPPPPYPFESPTAPAPSPARPFLTGPDNTMKNGPTGGSNGKPVFITQNRLPWQRPHPRPPIGAMGNRPLIPTFNQQPPLPTLITDFNENTTKDNPQPGDNYEVSESVNEVSDSDAITTSEPQHPPSDDTHNAETSDELVNVNHTETHPDISAITLQPSTAAPAGPTTDAATASTTHKTPSLDVSAGSLANSGPIHTAPTTTIPQVIRTTSDAPTNAAPPSQYVPRPGLVLDDPEFKPGQKKRNNFLQQRPQQPHSPARPPGYGEIFDITLSAIQGPTGGGSGVQTINIKPYGAEKYNNNDDIIVSPTGSEGFVSIDGKRTYIDLFNQQTDSPQQQVAPTTVAAAAIGPAIRPTPTVTRNDQQQTKAPHYGIVENAPLNPNGLSGSVSNVPHKPLYRPRPAGPPSATPSGGGQQGQGPPLRIDTCIVGDDSTCDKTQNEACRIEFGVSSCHCKPGYARRNDRDPCRRIVSLLMSLRVDKIFERKLSWDTKLAQAGSEPYLQLSYEAQRAVASAMDMTPFSDDFMEARVNKIYKGDATRGEAGIFVNVTLRLTETGETVRPAVKNDIQKHLLGVIHRRNNNIGNSALYVESPTGAVSHLHDVDECSDAELNDCHSEAVCTNTWGSFACECQLGYRDPWADQVQRAGRECLSCPDSVCNNRGTCIYSEEGKETCSCSGNYYGSQCEIDGEVLGVAIGASVAAVIIIVLTLICLIMWSRRWQREQKQLVSPVFGYMNTVQQMKAQQAAAAAASGPYTISLEDRMRWAQIADVMAAQSNHYAAEPVPATMRPGSSMYNYPNLQALSNMGTLSMAGTLPMGGMPPIPMPR